MILTVPYDGTLLYTANTPSLPSSHVILRLDTALRTGQLAVFHSLKATNRMATFNSLPNELIREIIRYVQPEDFENFAAISSNVYSLASPFLTEHRALIRQYSTFCAYTGSRSITDLLGTVLANPRIGSYVRKLELARVFPEKKVEYTKEELEIFTSAALDSECLPQPSEEVVLDEKDFWSREIRSGNDDILLAILLPLLPNLATLAAEAHLARKVWYDEVLERAGFTKKPTLTKLAQIRLDSSTLYGAHFGAHLAEIQRLSALPSVRAITAMEAYGLDCLQDISPDTRSNVTHLKLWHTTVDSKGLYEFLRGFPKLQSFTYSHTYEPQPPPDPFLIRASLLAHCKATLQNLTLLDSRFRRTSFMGSLRGFEALKELYTEWSFLGPLRNSCTLQLDEHLPASLVRLKIHDSTGREKSEYERVIKSAQYAKEHQLQNFKWLVFGGTKVAWSLETVDWSLRKTCLNMGITLIFSPYAPKSGD